MDFIRQMSSNLSRDVKPLEGELNPGSESSFERSSPAQLGESGIISAQKNVQLPTELWIEILEIVLESQAIPYNRCNSSNFPIYRSFTRPLRMKEATTVPQKDYRCIRLVCRSWANLADLSSMGRLAVWSENEFSGNNHRLRSCLKAAPQLTTLVLYMKSKSTNQNPLGTWPADLLLKNSVSLLSLRSLSMDHKGVSSNYWAQFQVAFPLLVSLTFRGKLRVNGPIYLPKLEILDVIWDWSTVYQFPSLKHCFFCYIYYSDGFSQFLKYHGERLESLILFMEPYTCARDRKVLDSEDSLWRFLPNLRTIGMSVDHITIDALQGPSRNTQLTTLSLFLKHVRAARDVSLMQIRNKLAMLPWVRRLYIYAETFTDRDHASLREICKAHNVTYTALLD